MRLYLGCPIWAYRGWVGSFYPEGTKPTDYLREYARRLTTVEGNTTFYAVPSAATIQHWAKETPDNFRFCPKLPRSVSHSGKLVEHVALAHQFLDVMSQLGARLGPMFLQLPPRYSPAGFEDMRAFLKAWPRQAELAVEVRHSGWFESSNHQGLNTLLTEHGAARVIIDTRPIHSLLGDRRLQGSVYQRMLEARQRKPNLPILPDRTAPFVFLRYIGHPSLEENFPILSEWADHVAGWLREGIAAYVFCHCPDERLDPWLCREFHRRVSASLPLPPLPWDGLVSQSPHQPRLL